ncbi:hypothetical protein M409DRAFT_52741 [Zasmidium cellare ATCC 36951]|uniref:AMP-dependent synthetase/ligase domain-containing protein n=1 Tax=Zasmidium cellare ATCC 36951 TaxID=1080233 RepID=A0A6A6CRA8_ZASCE|nr:uncharacterized protein M409DRAFT_52741 [Zasmidium cellare ATCC 36951]KAF2168708.1 hypothetical protein M409DRAFT_52741 [Zasmidium cellare ATCC 36951]
MASVNFTEGHIKPPTAIHDVDQLLPNIVDGMAAARSHAVYAQIPNSFTSYAAGFRKVTYRHLANAVNGIAWLLSKELGQGKNTETLAYIGPNDIGYVVAILGAAKAGYAILVPSPRLVQADCVKLLDTASCKTLLTLQPPHGPLVQNLLKSGDDLPVISIPTIYELLGQQQEHYPYPHRYQDLKDRPLCMVHTSGTTGAPKPLIWTHKTAAAFIRELRAPPPENYSNAIAEIQSNTMFALFPFFHSGGIMIALIDAIASQTTVVCPLAGVPPSTPTIIEGLQQLDMDVFCAPAPFLEEIAKKPEWISAVTSRASAVVFSGADVSYATGRAFTKAGVRIQNLYGSSEGLTMPAIRARKDSYEDAWQYIQPHAYANITFQKQKGSDEEMFELVWIKNDEPEEIQPIFTVYPHLEEFHPRDLFSPHPHDQHLWRFRGRSDDLIATLTGELCNPIAFEQELSTLPEVNAVLLSGTGRWQKVLLVEPADAKIGDLIERIWPSIERANEKLSKTSRLAKTHVLVTSPDRPMLRSRKGTVQRAPTLRLYEQEIDDLYRIEGDGDHIRHEPIPVHLDMAGREREEL